MCRLAVCRLVVRWRHVLLTIHRQHSVLVCMNGTRDFKMHTSFAYVFRQPMWRMPRRSSLGIVHKLCMGCLHFMHASSTPLLFLHTPPSIGILYLVLVHSVAVHANGDGRLRKEYYIVWSFVQNFRYDCRHLGLPTT